MNQAEQTACITPLEAAAKAIFSLQRQVAEQDERIVELERLTDRLVDRGEHIERLKRDVKLNSGLINCLQNVGLKDNKRIERLETALGFSDGSTYTAERARQIEDWGGGSH